MVSIMITTTLIGYETKTPQQIEEHKSKRKILLIAVGSFSISFTETAHCIAVEVQFDEEEEIESGEVYDVGRKAVETFLEERKAASPFPHTMLNSIGTMLDVEGGSVEELLAEMRNIQRKTPEYKWGVTINTEIRV